MSATVSVLVGGTVPGGQLARLKSEFPDVHFHEMDREGPVPETARTSLALLTVGQHRHVLEDALTALPLLTWVHTVSAGVDRHVPLLRGTGITLTRTAAARAVPMAEHVLAMTLALLKRLPELTESQRLRMWRRPRAGLLAGATVGIIGAGSVGQASAVRFKAFGARTLGLSSSGSPATGFDEVWRSDGLEDLLGASDIVVVACPLTPNTRGMLGRQAFEQMRPGALLVNVARGGIVEEAELVAALDEGRLAGAAMDVFEVEPLPPENPLWTLPNLIVTPHSSSNAPEVWGLVMGEFIDNLKRFLRHEPLANKVDVDGRGY